MRLVVPLLASLIGLCPAVVQAQPVPAAVTMDPPADKRNPPTLYSFALPTHGVNINAVLLTAAGPGPHPTVLLLHGFPGNEQNLDLAQAIRRDGWNVLTLHYRGSWGSPGDFTFTHVREGAAAALAWLRHPSPDAAKAIDKDRIVVVGHSMGGWAAAFTGASDPGLLATAVISPAPINARPDVSRAALVKSLDENMGATAGMHALVATPDGLANEVTAAGESFDFTKAKGGLSQHPLLVVTSDDGLAFAGEALGSALRAGGKTDITQVHMATDHSYSDHRIALETTVLQWLETLPGAPRR